MGVLIRFFNFYIYSSIHVALAVVAFTWLSYIELGEQPRLFVLFFVFFSSVLGYNFVKYFGFIAAFKTNKASWFNQIIALSFLSLIGASYLILKFNSNTIWLVFLLALLTFFYATPLSFVNSRTFNKQSLRGMSGVKVFIIALVWSCTTVLLPVLEASNAIQGTMMIILIQRFLWVLILMIPFEIRDLNYDHPDLGTIPQVLGVAGAKVLGYSLILAIVVLELTKSAGDSCFRLISVVMLLLATVLIYGAKTKSASYYCAFWVEGVPILWLGLVLVFC